MPEPDSARSAARSARQSGILTPSEDARWAALAHLGGVVGVIPSLAVFLTLKNRGVRTTVESKEALNWQVTLIMGLVVLDVLAVIVGGLVVLVTIWTGHPGLYPVIGRENGIHHSGRIDPGSLPDGLKFGQIPLRQGEAGTGHVLAEVADRRRPRDEQDVR